jgi:hypothetical protein
MFHGTAESAFENEGDFDPQSVGSAVKNAGMQFLRGLFTE